MIIGLSGYAQVGKDTVANYLVDRYGFTKVSFADPLREALYRLDPKVDVADMRGISLATAVDSIGWEGVKADSPDTRRLLQRMGTEVGRTMFGDDVWAERGILEASMHTNAVIADTRYRNEADAIVRSGGRIWRINKDSHGPVNEHASEIDLDGYDFKYVIFNNSDREALYDSVDEIMNN